MTTIQIRRGTASEWDTAQTTLSTTPILGAGEFGLETDTMLLKVGDGTNIWGDLEYLNGQQNTLCYNGTGSTIPKGSVVYISGAQGANPSISIADADAESTSSKTLGITTKAITTGNTGPVGVFGRVMGVNTSGFTAGDALWLSSTAGGLTNVKPTAPTHQVFIGYCVKAGTSGSVFVNPQNGYELDELHDILITSKTNNDLLTYESSSGLWKNKSFSTLDLLTATTAASTYLTQSNAASTYLTQANATSTYLTQSSATSTYLTQSNAATTYQPKDADLTAIAALAGTSGLLKKTAADSWTLDTNTYLATTASQFVGHHPEGRIAYNAYLTNDFANARLRGSTITITQNGSPYSVSNANIDAMFDGTASFWNISPTSGFTFPLVIEFTLPRTLTYGTWIGIGFGNAGWRANSVKIEVYSNDSSSWVSMIDTTTNTSEDVYVSVSGLTNGNAAGISKVRYTLANPNSTQLRIAHIWGYNFASDMWSTTMMPRSGGAFYNPITTTTVDPATIPLITKGAASQTSDLQQWQSSASGVLAKVDASGNITSPSLALTANTLSTSTTTGTLKVTGGAGITEKLFVGSDLSVGGNLSVTGNITFGGSSTVLTATNLEVTDSLIYLASTQYTTDSMDIGIFGAYSPTGTGHVHTGLVRNSSSKVWNLISGAAEPTGNSVSLTGVTYDILKIGSLQVTDAATTRTNLGLAIGTNVQAYNSALTSISSTQVTNWDTAYTDRNKWDGASIAGSGTVEIARSTLGLGTMAVETATGYYAKAPTILGASEDLNLKTTAGLYHQNANVDAASGTNYPAAQAGMLIVHVGEGFIYQQYQTYGISGANKIYHRGYYSAGNPVWSAWREVVNTDGATFTGAVALNGGFSVDSTAFSVADTTGNTSVGGTLSVSGTSTLSGHVTVASTKQSAIATSQTSTTAGTNTWSANKVVMTAGVASAAIPTFRPDGSALQAGDIWISW